MLRTDKEILALKNDIIKHQKIIHVFYPKNFLASMVVKAITEAKDSENFMVSMKIKCSAALENAPTLQKTILNKKAHLLCKAIVEHDDLVKIWPDILTFDELVGALQKVTFINFVEKEKDNLPSSLQFTLEDLCVQIKESYANTSLNDILRKDSLFLKIKRYDQAALEAWLTDNKIREELNDFASKIIVGDMRAETFIDEEECRVLNLKTHNELIQRREEYIKVGHLSCRNNVDALIAAITTTLTQPATHKERYMEIHDKSNKKIPQKTRMIFNNFQEEEKKLNQINKKILKALLELDKEYRKFWRWQHRNDIRNLILYVVDIQEERRKEKLSSKHCYDLIKSKIQQAFNIERNAYVKDAYTFFPRTAKDFTKTLRESDYLFCYARGLKKILDFYKDPQIPERAVLEEAVPKRPTQIPPKSPSKK